MINIVDESIKLIQSQIESHNNPIVMSSFGKDSIVMLDLISKAGYKLPVLFHKEAFEPKKYEFANRVISDNDYTVYDYPPLVSSVTKRGDFIEIINHHQVRNRTCYMPTGIIRSNQGLCGLDDIYNKPHGTFEYPWDLGFVGHKNSDQDFIIENSSVGVDFFSDPDGDFCFPLRHFTDTDVWNYTLENNLPINHLRYDKDNNWKEFDDITYNPDYFHACVSCIDKDEKEKVFCPKLDMMILNVSKQINYIDPISIHYAGEVNV